VALIAVEGKLARPVRVGARVDDELVLLTVHRRGAGLGPSGGEPTVRLELPERPPPATGVPGAAAPTSVAAPPPVPVPSAPPAVEPVAPGASPQPVPGMAPRAFVAPGTAPGLAPAQPATGGVVQ
jgi:general secretion pathway protein C